MCVIGPRATGPLHLRRHRRCGAGTDPPAREASRGSYQKQVEHSNDSQAIQRHLEVPQNADSAGQRVVTLPTRSQTLRDGGQPALLRALHRVGFSFNLALRMRGFPIGVICGALAAGAVSCSREPGVPKSGSGSSPVRRYEVRGTIVGLDVAASSLVVRHEEIPGFMRAMTMPFEVRDTNELTGLQVGDTIRFRLNVTEAEGWIDRIEPVAPPSTNRLPLSGPFRVVRDVDPLQPGDLLPAYPLTDQWGKAISTLDFRGRVLVLSFVYTRCPFPTFCPRTMQELSRARKELLASGADPRSWHFLTVSFDPDFDTPEVLQAYGQSFGVDFENWTLATGALIEVTALAEQFGLMFWREDAGWAHNLRTAVIDPAGRVHRILIGNHWTAGELTAAVREALNSAPPPGP